MSRSVRHIPIVGDARASNKTDKARTHRKVRAAIRSQLPQILEEDVPCVEPQEVSHRWFWRNDRIRYVHDDDPKTYRK